jgi:hypothetical protein
VPSVVFPLLLLFDVSSVRLWADVGGPILTDQVVGPRSVDSSIALITSWGVFLLSCAVGCVIADVVGADGCVESKILCGLVPVVVHVCLWHEW